MLKRPIALILLFTTVPQLGGCAIRETVSVRPAELTTEERNAPGDPRVVGVVYGNGERLVADSQPPAAFVHDTLRAWVGGGEHLIPRGLVQSLLVTRYDRDPVAVAGSDPTQAAEAVLGPHVVAVQAWHGGEVQFDRGRAVWYAADTLHGVVRGAPFRLAADSIRAVRVVRTNTAVSTIASVPLILAGGLLLLGILYAAGCRRGSMMC